MKKFKIFTSQFTYVVIALGLTGAIFTTPTWGEILATPQATATKPTEEAVPLVDNRLLAIGLGAVAGVTAYSLLTGNWGIGTGMRIARAGIPGTAALRVGSAWWGGRWVFSTASGLVGALVGDWIYRNNQATH